MSIATQTGDDGTTGLMYGRRVPKTHPRIAANGATDELNAALGIVRATVAEPFVTDAVLTIQRELVLLMGELAVLPEDRDRYTAGGFTFLGKDHTDALTARIHDLEKNHRISYHGWATPGGTPGSATLDVARTVCRRAERHIAALAETLPGLNPELLRYLNRLSDLCWLWARWLETPAAPPTA